jgi:hypothetical protein
MFKSESALFPFVVKGPTLNFISRMWKDKDVVTDAFGKGAKVCRCYYPQIEVFTNHGSSFTPAAPARSLRASRRRSLI